MELCLSSKEWMNTCALPRTPRPKRTLEWMTPTEAATEEGQRKVRKELAAQMESLHLKEQGLGEHVPTVGTSLLRIGRLLRKLGPTRKAECLEALHRSASIFETHYRQARLASQPANPSDNSAELEDTDTHGGSPRPDVSTGIQPNCCSNDPRWRRYPCRNSLRGGSVGGTTGGRVRICFETFPVYIANNDFKWQKNTHDLPCISLEQAKTTKTLNWPVH